MSGLKELKRRQKTAMIIERMTGAMRMISRARYTAMQNDVRKNQDICQPLKDLAHRIMATMAGDGEVCSVPYAAPGPEDAPWLLVLMTSDGGLCGGFNQKLIKAALEWLEERKNETVHVLCVGKKGMNALQKKSAITVYSCEDLSIKWQDHVIDLFKNKKIRGCFAIYGKFFNILTQEPHLISILPFVIQADPGLDQNYGEQNGEGQNAGLHNGLLTIEPNAETVLNSILEVLVQAFLEKITKAHTISEHAARMNAMDSANDNAKDMIRRLQIKYNRLRQDRITKEIIEIVSGSEAAGSA
jgi:F-type H+-transporting ATPase subunit gamma